MSQIIDHSAVLSAEFRQVRDGTQRQYGTLRRVWRSCAARCERFARQRPLAFAAGIVTILFAIVIWLMPPAFQTNDDAVMCMIAAGQGIALAPDEHLVFTNVLIGKTLKWLYCECPTFHWYGWYLVVTQGIATTAILYCLLRPRYTRLSMLGFFGYFFTAGIYFLVNLQFTATASLTGIAGGVLLLQILRNHQSTSSEQSLQMICGCLLIVFSGLIRSDAFILTIIIVSPVLVAVAWANMSRRGELLKVGCALAAALGMMWLAERGHELAYSENNWLQFYQYNPLRIKFNDENWVKYQPETKHVFDQVGWSKNDFEMIHSWYYDDPQYDEAQLRTILNSYNWGLDREAATSLSLMFKEMFRQQTFRGILGVMPGMLLFFDRRRRQIWPCVTAFVAAWGILLAIAVFRKPPPERVFMPVTVFPWLVVLMALAPGWREKSRAQRGQISRVFSAICKAWQVRHWSWFKPNAGRYLALRMISLLLVIGLIISVSKQLRTGIAHTKQLAKYRAMLDDMRPQKNQSECLVLTFGADFPYEYQAVLFGKNDYTGLRFFTIGWPQRTPLAEQMKQHFQIENLGQAIATRRDLKLFVNIEAYPRIVNYLAERYDAALQIVNLKTYREYALAVVTPSAGSANLSLQSRESPFRLVIPTLQRLGFLR